MTPADFSAAFPIGTPIRYFPISGTISCAIDSEIASEAWALGSGHVVVKIAAKSGGVSIMHVRKRTIRMTDDNAKACDGKYEYLMQFFAFSHLPAHLQDASRPFGELAQTLVDTLPSNPERTTALRKLLEAKDCAVRARLFK